MERVGLMATRHECWPRSLIFRGSVPVAPARSRSGVPGLARVGLARAGVGAGAAAALAVAALVGCGGAKSLSEAHSGAPNPPGVAAAGVDPAEQAEDERGTAAQRLATKLEALPLSGGVLDGAPPEVVAFLKAAVSALPDDVRENLPADAKLAERHPMLHVFAGGREPVAWCRLATDPRVAYPWFRKATPGVPNEPNEPNGPKPETTASLAPRVEGAGRVMERAAAYCLRDFALVLKARGNLASERMDVLSDVARLHAAPETVVEVMELFVETQPTSDTWTQLALWRARELDATGARSALKSAQQAQSEAGSDPSTGANALLDESIAAAMELGENNGSPLERARSLLSLGRVAQARSAIHEAALAPNQHLGSAAVMARAALVESSCSRLDGGAWTSSFCRAFWRSDAGLQRALAALEEAWSTGAGRDAEAVETYLAIAHVLRDAVTGVEGVVKAEKSPVAAAARATADLSARLAGIAFYAAVREGIAKHSTLAQLEAMGVPSSGAFLLSPDRTLEPSEPFVQAAWLNIAMAHGATEDVSEVLARVPRAPRRDLVAIAAALGLRNAALHRREDYAEAAAYVVESIATADDPGLVLLLAETEAVETPDAMTRLLALARRLTAPGNDPVLRVRAALDAATVQIRAAHWSEVESTLAPFQGTDPKVGFFWALARFADGQAERGSLNAALHPLKGAANLGAVDWRRWIADASQHRASNGVKAGVQPSSRPWVGPRLADMSRWASGYRVTADARIEPSVVFLAHLWPVP
jgi:hypothetical protein